MNFLHLKYFLLVAEELNITRAAERLYISQQSLSNHISNMERELDVKLFTRSPKLSLTYAGDLLVETATQILDLHSQYLAKVGDINRHYMGVLRLGISHTCGLALLPEILPQFQAEFPMEVPRENSIIYIKRMMSERRLFSEPRLMVASYSTNTIFPTTRWHFSEQAASSCFSV